MKHATKVTTILSGMAILMVAGCQKETTTTTPQPNDANSSEKSIVIGDQVFDGINNLSFSYFSSAGLKSAAICPAITATLSTSFPLVITFDWGTGCPGTVDAITRSGKIAMSLSGKMNEPNSVATFMFTDFVSEGNKISGVHKITYKGLNAGNNWPRYEVFTEARIEFPDKKFMTYRAVYVRLQSEGLSTTSWTDDVWRIEGTSSGTTREGIAWIASYPSAVTKKMSCKYFSSGSVLVTPAGGLPRTIDFGDGTCDNKATLKIGDVTTNIEL
jgi:hypothetical protein